MKSPCTCGYSYSRYAIPCLPFSPILQALADCIERALNVTVNSVNANYYSDAKAMLGLHSDNEFLFQADKQASCIVSVSFGATRKFVIKNKRTGLEIYQKLSHGDVLTMEGLMQRFYEHGICQATLPVGARLNLAFRQIVAHGDSCPLVSPS